MFIYADESGNSGREIFKDQPTYFLGALLSNVDLDSHLQNLMTHFKEDNRIENIHAKSMLPSQVHELARLISIEMQSIRWEFHLTSIDKQYISVLKFVDTIFDSDENASARFLWYKTEMFRHALCCLIDDSLSESDRKEFWAYYLDDNYDGLALIAGRALINIESADIDPRLKEVSTEALVGFIKNPRQVSLNARTKRKSYKNHTPNMIAFSGLVNTINRYASDWDSPVEKFIHDAQNEFQDSMRDNVELFSAMRIRDIEDLKPLEVDRVDSWKRYFVIESSTNHPGLQACDIFLWLIQRATKTNGAEIPSFIRSKINEYSFSKNISAMIVDIGFLQSSLTDLTPDDIEAGKALQRKMEVMHKSMLKDKTIDSDHQK